MRTRFTLLFLVFLSLLGCNSGKNRLNVDVSEVQIPRTIIHRYDLDLFKVNPADLQSELMKLKSAYPFFLGTDLSQPYKLEEMRQYLENRRNQECYAAVSARYKNLDHFETALHAAFQHLKYYDPAFKAPRVYTYISGGDFDYPVQFADSVILIGIDNYLGKDFSIYKVDGVPSYRVVRMNEENLLPDCMKVLIRVTYPEQIPGNNLLEQIVESGKRLYLLDAMIPDSPDRLKIGYTETQFNWVVKNEKQVWAAIISNGLLYSTNGQLIRSFLADGPFTPEFSKDSPPRLGEWLGWQIVSGYMERNREISPAALMSEKDAQKILSMSGFKPGD